MKSIKVIMASSAGMLAVLDEDNKQVPDLQLSIKELIIAYGRSQGYFMNKCEFEFYSDAMKWMENERV